MIVFIAIVIFLAIIVLVAKAVRSSGTANLTPRSPRGPTLGRSLEAPAQHDPDCDESFEVGEAFFCDTSRSPNRRYLVGAADAVYRSRGQQRKGACALKDTHTGTTCFKKAIARAHNPHVSDDGLVVVEDWKEQGLSGALIGFDRSGARLWAMHFNANIFTSGLSSNGHRAFVSTCNANYEPHSGKTFFLDARAGTLLWKHDGWGGARFDGDVLVQELKGTNGEELLFSFDDAGRLPADYYEAFERAADERGRGTYWWVLPRVQDALKQSDVAAARSLLAGLQGKEAVIPDSSRAKLLRFRGEVAEADGDRAAALDLWGQALELDPRVGIKRRFDALAQANS